MSQVYVLHAQSLQIHLLSIYILNNVIGSKQKPDRYITVIYTHYRLNLHFLTQTFTGRECHSGINLHKDYKTRLERSTLKKSVACTNFCM